MRGFSREFLLHIGMPLVAIMFASALVAAGASRILALISVVIPTAVVIGLVTHRSQRREEARIAEMPADDAEAHKARALRAGLIWATVLLVAVTAIAVWAQTPQAFALLALYGGFAVWFFRLALRERRDQANRVSRRDH